MKILPFMRDVNVRLSSLLINLFTFRFSSMMTRTSLQFSFKVDHSKSMLQSDARFKNYPSYIRCIQNSPQLQTRVLISFDLDQFLLQSSFSSIVSIKSMLVCQRLPSHFDSRRINQLSSQTLFQVFSASYCISDAGQSLNIP